MSRIGGPHRAFLGTWRRRPQERRGVDRARQLGIGLAPERDLMLARLRADLHVHTREAEPSIAYGARDIIVRAARLGYRVLSITNHDAITYDAHLAALAAFARDHDVLLIPGVEATVEGRHVLVYNADVEADKLRTFADLRRYRTPEWLVGAARPARPPSSC